MPELALQTPYGNISSQPVLLMEMLAACPAWQEWCAESDDEFPASGDRAGAAMDYIYYTRAPRYALVNRTCNAVVYPVPRSSFTSDCSDSLGDEFTPTGTIALTIQRKVPAQFILDATDYESDDPEEVDQNNDIILDSMAAMDFDGWADGEGDGHGLGKIIEELCAQSGINGNLVINQIQTIDGPGFSPDEEIGDIGLWRGVRMIIKWGIPM